jgi:hypothetical protein
MPPAPQGDGGQYASASGAENRVIAMPPAPQGDGASTRASLERRKRLTSHPGTTQRSRAAASQTFLASPLKMRACIGYSTYQ